MTTTYTDALTDGQCVEICQRLPLGCAGFVSVEAIRYALAPLLTERQAAMQGRSGEWIDGYPNKIYASEWFIAQTKNRERVVLTSLPEEYAYDFKTADETYIKKENIVRWMQFPDSQFIPAIQPPQPARSEVSDAMVDTVARHLQSLGWATGGDYEEDFEPDVRAALEHFAAIAKDKPHD